MTLELFSKDEETESAQDTEETIVKKVSKKVYRLIDDNLSSVGGIETAAGFCGIDRGDLRKAIDRGTPRQPRYLAIEHVIAIMTRMRLYNVGKATEIAATIVHPVGLLVSQRRTITAEEKARRLEAKLNQIGNSMGIGDQLVEDALRTP